jgi:hypothetical protein
VSTRIGSEAGWLLAVDWAERKGLGSADGASPNTVLHLSLDGMTVRWTAANKRDENEQKKNKQTNIEIKHNTNTKSGPTAQIERNGHQPKT